MFLLVLLLVYASASQLSFQIDGAPSAITWESSTAKARFFVPLKERNAVLQEYNGKSRSWDSVLWISPSLLHFRYILKTDAQLQVKKSFTVQKKRQWALVYFEDFQGRSSRDWVWNADQSSVTHCPASKDKFLGGFGQFSSHETEMRIHLLDDHHRVKVTARFHLIDKWEGESLIVKLNDKIIWTHSHTHCKMFFQSDCRGMHSCGSPNYPDELSVYMEVEIAHTETELKLTVLSTLEKSPVEASYGIDDVHIYVI